MKRFFIHILFVFLFVASAVASVNAAYSQEYEYMNGILIDDPTTGKAYLLMGDLFIAHKHLMLYTQKNLYSSDNQIVVMNNILWAGELMVEKGTSNIIEVNETSGLMVEADVNPFFQPGEGIKYLQDFLSANPEIKEKYFKDTKKYITYDPDNEHLQPGIEAMSFIRHDANVLLLKGIYYNIQIVLNIIKRDDPKQSVKEGINAAQEKAKKYIEAYRLGRQVCAKLDIPVFSNAINLLERLLNVDPDKRTDADMTLFKDVLPALKGIIGLFTGTDEPEKYESGIKEIVSGKSSNSELSLGRKIKTQFNKAREFIYDDFRRDKNDEESAKGKYLEAVDNVTTIIENQKVWSNEIYIKLYYLRSALYIKLKEYSKANDDLVKVLQFKPEIYKNHKNFRKILKDFGKCSAFLGNTEKIELVDIPTSDKYETAFFYLERSLTFHKELARYQDALNDLETAETFLAGEKELIWLVGSIYYERGFIYADLKDYNKAEEMLKQAHKLGYRGPDLYGEKEKEALSDELSNKGIANMKPYEVYDWIYFGKLSKLLFTKDYKEQAVSATNAFMTKLSYEEDLEGMAKLREISLSYMPETQEVQVENERPAKPIDDVLSKITDVKDLLQMLFSVDGEYSKTFEAMLENAKREDLSADKAAKIYMDLIALSVVLTYIASEKPELLPKNSDVKTIAFKVTEFGGRVFTMARNFEEEEGKTVEFSLDKTYRDEYDRYVRDIKNGRGDRY